MPSGYLEARECNARKDSIEALASDVALKLGYAPGGDLKPIVESLGGRITYQRGRTLRQ